MNAIPAAMEQRPEADPLGHGGACYEAEVERDGSGTVRRPRGSEHNAEGSVCFPTQRNVLEGKRKETDAHLEPEVRSVFSGVDRQESGGGVAADDSPPSAHRKKGAWPGVAEARNGKE